MSQDVTMLEEFTTSMLKSWENVRKFTEAFKSMQSGSKL